MGGLRLVLAGAAIGNGNRGVEALGQSVIDSVDRESPGALLSLLDDGWGVRSTDDARHPRTALEFVGVRRSRRWHRPESWARVRVAQAVSARTNPVAQRFAAADAVLDLSAGDSFTDLYGPRRLATISAPKQAALRAGRPLVLLPQTYGPFETATARRRAERIIRSSALAYARDAWSYDRLLELAGPDADHTRLREGVDLAFALEPRRPEPEVVQLFEALPEGTVAGVNVSGLLRDAAGHQQFGLVGSYLDTMTGVIRGLIASDTHVILVPHVHVRGGHGESDLAAISQITRRLNPDELARTTVLPAALDAAELKWCISQCDWFVGSRMHATIAALSTQTPATAYAYSDKTLGVFRTCGMGDYVVDARHTGGPAAIERILADFAQHESLRATLRRRAPGTVEQSRSQLRTVLNTIAQWRDAAAPVESIA